LPARTPPLLPRLPLPAPAVSGLISSWEAFRRGARSSTAVSDGRTT
jgi:hypothetical protein